MNRKSFTQKRKTVSKIILVTFYSAFIGYLLAGLQWIADWNYSIHEMLYIPYSIAYFLVPFELLAWIYYAAKSKREVRENDHRPRNKEYLINLVLSVSLILIATYFYIQSMTIVTSGLFEVEQKIQDKNKYYIQLDDQRIRCTHNEFNLIEEGRVYLVTFSWNKESPDKGKLELIEPTEVTFD